MHKLEEMQAVQAEQVDHLEDGQKVRAPPAADWSPEEEKKAVRKLDWNLIPLLGSLYLVSYIDRGNIGNAYTAGMGEEWGITSEQYSMVVTVLYIGYIAFHWVCEPPLSIELFRVPLCN